MGRVLLATGSTEKKDKRRVASRTYGEVDDPNDRHTRASVDFCEFSQCNEGRLANLTQPSRREEACLLNPCIVVAQLVTSQPDAVDTTMTFM